ncbi:hypothetical protein HUA78_45460 [Myxococcus sp. CA033]|uniref:hypothetical protein n=1 Tax=Myxococcus sp. CA033 TaxID=2741516 RepID=UPI001C2DC4F7|nr:hypothetical protein [Myxococcus sp. CA033]NTX41699.1 hypothetical protein [Myxococcus sp. CA033]
MYEHCGALHVGSGGLGGVVGQAMATPSQVTPTLFVALQVVAVEGQLTDPFAQDAVQVDSVSEDTLISRCSSDTSAGAAPHPMANTAAQLNSNSPLCQRE